MISISGTTVLDRAVIEHNLLSASTFYANICLTDLGELLGVDADKAERYAARMMMEGRMRGSIDQQEGFVFFAEGIVGGCGVYVCLRCRFFSLPCNVDHPMLSWDANIATLCNEINELAEAVAVSE